jgi:hypothetical protein
LLRGEEGEAEVRRLVVLVLGVAFSVTLAVVPLLDTSVYAQTTTERLPDLGMRNFDNIYIQETTSGKRLLRFDSTIQNAGTGPFEVNASRSRTTSGYTSWSVAQRIYSSSNSPTPPTSSYRNVSTPDVRMVWSGDGHNHWHIRNLATYGLERMDNGVKVGTGVKSGFCFFDSDKGNARLPKYYVTTSGSPGFSCAQGKRDALQVKAGISAGWGDIYRASLRDQYIDVTKLTAGRYRLRGTADAQRWFRESNTSNNVTWVELHIDGNNVRVVQQGPGMSP